MTPNTTSEPVRVLQPVRTLLAWMDTEQARLTLTARQQIALTPEQEARFADAKAALAERPAGYDASNVIQEPTEELENYFNEWRSLPLPAAYTAEGWTLKIADLSRVCALQRAVQTAHAQDRVETVDASSLLTVAEVTLPKPGSIRLPLQFDQFKNTWLFSSANPNLRLVGNFHGDIGSGNIGFGFIVNITPSFLQVAGFQGRYILRDGYHRAYGLLSRGITHAPVLYRDFGSFEELALPPGMLNQDAYLGDRPALLRDFFADGVSVEAEVPVVQKLVLIQATELSTFG